MIELQHEGEDWPQAGADGGPADAVRVPLGQLVVDAGIATKAQIEEALADAARTGERIGEVVVRQGLATEDDVARLFAEQWGLDYVERSAIWFDADALARLSREDAQQLEALPTRIEDGRVVVAVAEPTDERLAAMREVIGEETVVIVVPKSALDAGLRSNLLTSRGDSPPSPEPEPPAPVLELELEEDPKPPPIVFAAPPEPEPPPRAPAQPPPPPPPSPPPPSSSAPELSVDEEADAVVALALEARAVAERLAAQAAAVQARASGQDGVRRQAEAYEARIAELERLLEEERAQLERTREQLRSLLDGLGG